MEPSLSLEGVVLAGAVCGEARAAQALAAAGGGAALVALLRLRQADDDHVLQTVFAFRQMLAHPAAAEYLVSRTGIVTCTDTPNLLRIKGVITIFFFALNVLV